MSASAESGFRAAVEKASGQKTEGLDFYNDDSDAATGDPEGEDGAEDTVRFNDDGLRAAFERYPAKKAAGSVLGLYLFNPARAESFAGHVMDLYMDEVGDDGAVPKDGVAELLSGRDGAALHPALVRSTFQPWVDAQLQGAGRLKTGFLTLLTAMGAVSRPS